MNTDKIAEALQHVTFAFLAGRPGAGKGTCGEPLLNESESMTRIIVSIEIERALSRMSNDNPKKAVILAFKSAGDLVPDEYVIPIILERVAELYYTEGITKFLMDGFPRTDKQIDEIFRVTRRFLMCHLVINEDEAVRRMLEDRRREDETPGICRYRQKVFNERTLPMIRRIAVLHPSNYFEIDTGTCGVHECVSRIKKRIQAFEEESVVA